MQKHFLISCALLFILPGVASAATVSLRATPTQIGAGDTIRVDVLLDSAIPTNAFSGTLRYSSAMLEPSTVSDGNSIVSMWVTRPVAAGSVPITFAGITPGGFSGNTGILFSVFFRAKRAGTVRLSVDALEVLRNDGTGSVEPTIAPPLSLIVGTRPLGGYTEPRDQTPPEPFTAFLGTDSQLSNGKEYLAFATLDKGSGVDHYAVAESRLPAFLLPLFPLVWHTTTSPYVLTDQELTSTVYIKAVDRAGNERLSIYPLHHLLAGYEKMALLAILIVVVFLWQKGVRGRRHRLHT